MNYWFNVDESELIWKLLPSTGEQLEFNLSLTDYEAALGNTGYGHFLHQCGWACNSLLPFLRMANASCHREGKLVLCWVNIHKRMVREKVSFVQKPSSKYLIFVLYVKNVHRIMRVSFMSCLVLSSPTENYHKIIISLFFLIFHALHENSILVCTGIIFLYVKKLFHQPNLVFCPHNQNSYCMVRLVGYFVWVRLRESKWKWFLYICT